MLKKLKKPEVDVLRRGSMKQKERKVGMSVEFDIPKKLKKLTEETQETKREFGKLF